MKARIIWNGMGGELDSTTVDYQDNDYAIADALVKLIRGNIVSPGDSIEIVNVD